MNKIKSTVEKILLNDEEALTALSSGYMNLSAYAKKIHREVEELTHKDVKASGIVMSLSRLSQEYSMHHPLVQEVIIKNTTTKSPLSEIVFEKNNTNLLHHASLHKKISVSNDDFLLVTLSTQQISIICSERFVGDIVKHFKEKPLFIIANLAMIGLSLDGSYYQKPNITYSLIRKIAQKQIPLAETITTHNEIIFIFDLKYLSEIVACFQNK